MSPSLRACLASSIAIAACSLNKISPLPSSGDARTDAAADLSPSDLAPTDTGPSDAASPDAPVGSDVTARDAPHDGDLSPDASVLDAPPDARLSCRSDRECAGLSQFCDTSQMACVDCLRDADCPTMGTVCASRRCVRPTACTSSRACPGQVCDTARMICVDCAVDADCAPGEACRSNACVPRPPGCDDDRNCSAPTPRCDTPTRTCVACLSSLDCPSGSTCNATGACVTLCTPGTAYCPDARTLRVCNPDGMGFRGIACPGAPGAAGTCAAGACSLTCASGLNDCDGNATNGCETDTRVSTAHCGRCGNACSAPGGTSVCRAGACSVGVCATGRGDCDGNAVNGCETDVTTSAAHCGRCGNSCGAGACTASACPRILRSFGGPAGLGTDCLPPNDDGSWAGPPPTTGFPAVAIDITTAFPTGLQYFDATYRSMYVNNNGNITFRGAVGTFTPMPFPVADQPMIAPWWGDVDTRGGGAPTRNTVCFAVEVGRVVVTWDRVGYFSSHDDLMNAFQLVLSTRAGLAAGDFDVEFRYERCEWTTGDASGGLRGLGGTPAQAGFDAGDRATYVALPMSRTMDVLNLCTTSNVGSPGIWRYQARGGRISPGT